MSGLPPTCMPGLPLTCMPGLPLTSMPGLHLTCMPGLHLTCMPGLHLTSMPGLHLTSMSGLPLTYLCSPPRKCGVLVTYRRVGGWVDVNGCLTPCPTHTSAHLILQGLQQALLAEQQRSSWLQGSLAQAQAATAGGSSSDHQGHSNMQPGASMSMTPPPPQRQLQPQAQAGTRPGPPEQQQQAWMPCFEAGVGQQRQQHQVWQQQGPYSPRYSPASDQVGQQQSPRLRWQDAVGLAEVMGEQCASSSSGLPPPLPPPLLLPPAESARTSTEGGWGSSSSQQQQQTPWPTTHTVRPEGATATARARGWGAGAGEQELHQAEASAAQHARVGPRDGGMDLNLDQRAGGHQQQQQQLQQQAPWVRGGDGHFTAVTPQQRQPGSVVAPHPAPHSVPERPHGQAQGQEQGQGGSVPARSSRAVSAPGAGWSPRGTPGVRAAAGHERVPPTPPRPPLPPTLPAPVPVGEEPSWMSARLAWMPRDALDSGTEADSEDPGSSTGGHSYLHGSGGDDRGWGQQQLQDQRGQWQQQQQQQADHFSFPQAPRDAPAPVARDEGGMGVTWAAQLAPADGGPAPPEVVRMAAALAGGVCVGGSGTVGCVGGGQAR